MLVPTLYNNCLGSTCRLGTSRFNRLVPRQRHAHTALAIHFRFAKQTQRRIRLAQRSAEVGKRRLGRLPFHQDHRRRRRPELTDQRDRQAEDGACVQGKLRQVLGNQGHQAGVMGARRHFAEPHLIALDEQFHAKQATAAQGFGHGFCNTLGFRQGNGAHGLWLPGFLIVALLLTMANRRAERGAADVAYGQQCDFVVEIDKAFDDHPALAGTPALLGVVPGFLHVVGAAQQALALARRTHHRLDHARKAQVLDGLTVVFEGVGEVVRRGRQVQLFGGQATDAFTVHGQRRGAGGRNDGKAFGLQLDQGRGSDGFDFRHDKVRLLRLDDRTQRGSVEHVDHMATVRHLHGRRVGVAIHGNHFNAQALQFDHHFLAQLTAATQQNAGRGWRQWSSDSGHLRSSGERIMGEKGRHFT